MPMMMLSLGMVRFVVVMLVVVAAQLAMMALSLR